MSRFFALSRTSHGLLGMATPAFCALLWLGHFPSWQTILLSLATAFAAYTAIYALNDLLGIRCDREKFSGARISPGYAVEASPQRHPLAQGLLSVRSGLLWMAVWLIVALVGSYLLNPIVVLVLLGAAALELIYCLLQNVTYLRTILSGLVKTGGPLAAILVVDRSPSLGSLVLVLAWVFFWEIGGQNIPSDWNYKDEDRRASAATVPIRFGLESAGVMVLAALGCSVIIGALLPMVSPARLGLLYVLASVLAGSLLLLGPGVTLLRRKGREYAARLFDRASYYPLSHLTLLSLLILAQRLASIR